jgi:hypothetical protein
LRNGQEHGIGIAYDEIARLGLSDNPLLVEERIRRQPDAGALWLLH